jgi:arachidonate 15-lipoxygenase
MAFESLRNVPTLSQYAPNSEARCRTLQLQRERYRYEAASANPLAPIAVAGRFPLSEQYGPRWALPYLPQLARSLVGAAGGLIRRAVQRDGDGHEVLRALFRLGRLPTPAIIDEPASDGAFARNWLDGTHPLLLERVRDVADLERRLAVSDDDIVPLVPRFRSLAEEIALGRLFVADYQLLQRSLTESARIGRDSRWRDKYLPAPVVLLHDLRDGNPSCALMPLAIRLEQSCARAPNPLYLRNQGRAWELAKIYVASADFNLQAMSSHIYRHHYVAEPIVLSTHRQLAADHPLHVLLRPHLLHTLAVNRAALNLLKKPGSVFDQIYAGRLAETRQIMIASHQRWSFRELDLETDLAARGIGDQPLDYPWRDDARLWRAAIERFVGAYVEIFYASDQDVRGDHELQSWFTELGAEDGGNLRGLTDSGRLDDRAELVALLAQILFMAGPGHAAHT